MLRAAPPALDGKPARPDLTAERCVSVQLRMEKNAINKNISLN